MSKCDQCHFGSGFHRPGCTATDHPAPASTEVWEEQAKMLRADLKVLQSFVDDLDEGEAVKAFYNVRAAVIAYLHEYRPVDQPAPATGGDLDVEAEREAFEKHFGPKDSFAWRNADGSYKVSTLQSAWEIWQAARRAPSNNSPVGGKDKAP